MISTHRTAERFRFHQLPSPQLQAALDFLVRLADSADRLVIYGCMGSAMTLALGAVRLSAVPLLAAALGTWGARRARRKAQGAMVAAWQLKLVTFNMRSAVKGVQPKLRQG